MSVRVNLLPREFEEKSRARRMVGLGVLVVIGWVALLAFVLLGKLAAVESAKDDRDAAQAQVNQLQAEIDSLAAFQALAAQLTSGNDVLAAAMSNEVSWAQLLNDVALTIPTTASLTQMQAGLLELPPGQVNAEGVFVQNEFGDVGVMTVEGYSIESFAPGVEAVLLRFGEVDNFFQQYLSQAAAAEIGEVGVTQFNADVRLGENARTNRYVDGLPEVGQ